MLIYVTGLRGIPGVMGGIETHCEELLPRIAGREAGVSITVAGRRPYLPGLPAYGAEFRGVKVTATASTRKQSTEAITGTLTAIFAAHRAGADAIHIHAIGPGLLTPLARLLGLRTVVTHHGTDYDRAKWGWFARTMLRLGENLSVYFADRVIAVSPSLAETLKRRFPLRANRIAYVPNGAPSLASDGEDSNSVLERFGLEPGNYILTVGRLVPEKGADYLIRAYRKSGNPCKLVIAGAADHESGYARALMEEADERVVFTGLQSREVLRHLYENAALFVLPSFHEGLPICALEAAHCGAPMLMSNIPANLDLGLPEAHYFPVGDEAALSKCLQKPYGAFAVDSEAVRARFDWDRIADQTLEIYRMLVKK